VRILLRTYSCLFAISLSLFALGITALAASSGYPLTVGFLPWNGPPLIYWLIGIAIGGLVAVYLTAIGRLRGLLFLWCLAVTGLLIRGFFLTSYVFDAAFPFKYAVWLSVAALVATLSAWPWARRR